MIDLATLTITQAHEHLTRGDFSALELAEVYCGEIEKKNKTINAYLEHYEDVRAQAKEADRRIKAGEVGLLTGIPLAIKDNILIEGRRASAASKILEGFIAPYDATAILRLKRGGVVFLGRTNMDEFAMGGSNENSAYGAVRNPHDTTRVSGGSSGGSAAAVAMDGALAALGSDTGGSVRQPAALCGVVGLKPTYGAVSRFGLIAMGSSLDQIGTIAKTVADAEILFEAIRGSDPKDSTTLPAYSFSAPTTSKFRIGVPRRFMAEGLDPTVAANFEKTLKKLRTLGHAIYDIELPNINSSLAIYYVIMPAEASSNLARFEGVKYGFYQDGVNFIEDYFKSRGAGFGREVKRRIMIGNYILSAGYYDAYYTKAEALRRVLRDDFKKAFSDVDIILTPTSPVPAFKIGEKSANPLEMYLADVFTVTANLVGVPALSVPSGFVEKDGVQLPLGVQFMGAWKREDILFQIGKELEKIKV